MESGIGLSAFLSLGAPLDSVTGRCVSSSVNHVRQILSVIDLLASCCLAVQFEMETTLINHCHKPDFFREAGLMYRIQMSVSLELGHL